MKIVLRVDDLGWTATEIEPAPMKAPDTGLQVAQRFHAAMQGQPYLGAIIPACVDDEGRGWLREAATSGMTPALHGWSHQAPRGIRDEFHDFASTDSIREVLEDGRDQLGRGIIRHYVPPYNALSADVIEACRLEGVEVIWGGGTHEQCQPSNWPTCPPPYPLGKGMMFVPSWAPLYGATRWKMRPEGVPLLEVLPALLSLPGMAVITLHLPWQAAHEPMFESVSRMVDLIGDRIISPDEYVEGTRWHDCVSK